MSAPIMKPNLKKIYCFSGLKKYFSVNLFFFSLLDFTIILEL